MSESVRISAGGLRIVAADGTVTECANGVVTITPPVYEGPRTLAAQLLVDHFAGTQQDMLHAIRAHRTLSDGDDHE